MNTARSIHTVALTSLLALAAAASVAALELQGYGMNQPVADNATADGRAKNRRAEIIIGDGS